MKLGGSLFVHNALKYDYCYQEAIASLCNLCDEVVVVDAESDDGTLAELHTLQQIHSNLKVFGGYKWECEGEGNRGAYRIAVLQNEAQKLVDCDWHITLQADEVIHEDSYPYIRQFIETTKGDTALNTRVNLFKDFNHYIRFDSTMKPCSDRIMRLAKKGTWSYGDGESVAGASLDSSIVDTFVIMHYGMVRKPDVFIDKIIDMQTWFGLGVDWRALKLKEEGKGYKSDIFTPDSEIAELRWTHPKVMTEWIKEREGLLNNE